MQIGGSNFLSELISFCGLWLYVCVAMRAVTSWLLADGMAVISMYVCVREASCPGVRASLYHCVLVCVCVSSYQCVCLCSYQCVYVWPYIHMSVCPCVRRPCVPCVRWVPCIPYVQRVPCVRAASGIRSVSVDTGRPGAVTRRDIDRAALDRPSLIRRCHGFHHNNHNNAAGQTILWRITARGRRRSKMDSILTAKALLWKKQVMMSLVAWRSNCLSLVTWMQVNNNFYSRSSFLVKCINYAAFEKTAGFPSKSTH